ncbi:NAD(P)-dependent oxidoreductase [Rhodobacteraceae bacterium D3-12]|nr:NAD(P)-dependent oxidoreductase [Rhodobacteraceae bacterium D3-12]
MGLTIVITGAAGFIGQATVAAALRHGHHVRAITRRPTDLFPNPVETIALDLAEPTDTLDHALDQADVVIHAAASMSGDPARTARDTLTATQNLLTAMQQTAPRARLVLLSSITVYDATATTITEDTPLDPHPTRRDTYAQAKLAQEAALAGTPIETWIARPGAVFGPGRIWNAHLGPTFGPLLLRLGSAGELPLLTRESCAEALIKAAETPVPGGGHHPLNLVADDLPTRARFLAALGPHAPRLSLPFPWTLLALVGTLLSPLPIRLPGLLRPRTLRARFGAKTYSNARAQSALGWRAGQPFENAMRAALEPPL